MYLCLTLSEVVCRQSNRMQRYCPAIFCLLLDWLFSLAILREFHVGIQYNQGFVDPTCIPSDKSTCTLLFQTWIERLKKASLNFAQALPIFSINREGSKHSPALFNRNVSSIRHAWFRSDQFGMVWWNMKRRGFLGVTLSLGFWIGGISVIDVKIWKNEESHSFRCVWYTMLSIHSSCLMCVDHCNSRFLFPSIPTFHFSFDWITVQFTTGAHL